MTSSDNKTALRLLIQENHKSLWTWPTWECLISFPFVDGWVSLLVAKLLGEILDSEMIRVKWRGPGRLGFWSQTRPIKRWFSSCRWKIIFRCTADMPSISTIGRVVLGINTLGIFICLPDGHISPTNRHLGLRWMKECDFVITEEESWWIIEREENDEWPSLAN